MQIASLLLLLGLVIIYGGYLVLRIGTGTLWPERRLSFSRLAIIQVLSLLLPWAGQSSVHFLMGFKGHPLERALADPSIAVWLPKILLFGPIIETMMVGGAYALTRAIPAQRVADAAFIMLTGAGAVLLHRRGLPVMIAWYFTWFATQAALFVWLMPRLGHLRTAMAIVAVHGLGNLGITASLATTHALRNPG